MTTKKYLIATGAVSLALLTAMPAFADTEKNGKDNNGLHLGSIVRLFNDKHNDDDKRDNDKKHATTTAQGTVSISGKVTAVNGNTITLSGKDGATYTVNAAGAAITAENRTLAITDIKVGDTLKVNGTLTGTTIVATKIRDKSTVQRDLESKLSNLRAGIVTAVNGTVLTITRFGTGTTSTINTNASTTIKVKGGATSTSAITPGSAIVVLGSNASTTPDSITATFIQVLNAGFGWMKHLFNR